MYKIVFSATGRTEKVADAFCSVFENVEKIDLSDALSDGVNLDSQAFCLIAAPVYGGRIPAPAVKKLLETKGNGAKAVVMAVYGNRAYDDALAELKYCAEKAGFVVCGAVAAVAQHSLLHDVAADRPDENDKKQLTDFANKIIEKIKYGDISVFTVPGKVPQKPAGGLPVHPKATQNCVKCGLCAEKCPAKAIPMDNLTATEKDKCITCMRCVEICPHNARVLMPSVIKMANPIMKKVWGKHIDNEFYF